MFYVISVFITLITVTFAYYKWIYQYWERKKLPYLKPTIPYGNITSPFNRKENIAVTFQNIYEEMKTRGWRHGGIYTVTSPAYFLVNLDYVKNFPDLARFLKVRAFPKDIGDFFLKVVKDTVNYREKNNFTRKDFMQLLIDLKNNKLVGEEGKSERGLTIEEVAAQSFVFFLAGFETSSTTMTFALYEMAKHQDIQAKVREEIDTVLKKHDGKITYEAIQEMKYMGQVIDETLRKYPPVPFLTRQCVKDYKIPNEDVTIEKGTTVIIPVLGIHYDKDIYPDPEKFDPERFTEENKNARHNYSHIPFGEGPRICIGMRFGLMQSKVGLTSLLKKYKFTVNKKTQEPIKFQVNPFILAAEGEIWLSAEKI
nr:PREDICTED: probable cytochrome P450 6a23 [Tribolium castaneum]|eukprot:XP_008200098.2 PREDICTED: probable cytochrome P450 6a23 [Tribolium castaneum]